MPGLFFAIMADMKQLLQSMKTGTSIVEEVPIPSVKPGCALVQTAASLVSAGTERMLVEFGQKNLLQKARSRPDLARQVVDKALREGVVTALEAAFSRLDQPMTMGYSSAGVILEVGTGLKGFKPGDRVACAGGGYAVHAEYAVVPANLLAHVPENVTLDEAAFTTLGAIAMHGFRLAQPQVGERVAIIGLGLLGLLACGIARAAGCEVAGIDVDAGRVKLAASLGYPSAVRADAEAFLSEHSGGMGWDIILICADTPSSDPVELAGKVARDRGRVIAIGAFGLNMPRKPYYDKELTFMVSRSYGPGRYDPQYEEQGQDYPAGYIRWTEGRNLQSVLDLQGKGLLDVKPLISHRFPINDALAAYDLITGKTGTPFLGVLLTYPEAAAEMTPSRTVPNPVGLTTSELPGLGVIGAGMYANSTFLPAVHRVGGVSLVGVASGTGLNARYASRKYGFAYSTSDTGQILADPAVHMVAILTRHDQHSRQVIAALAAGKHVYCEKPLAIDTAGVEAVMQQLEKPTQPLLMVGFNRRFAPLAARLHEFIAGSSEPRMVHYTVNAGAIPLTHWTQDPEVGGGRIIGEGCHFIDLVTWLAGSLPVCVVAHALPDGKQYRQDNVSLTITYANGSVGVVDYLANGDKAHPKERCEVFCAGRVGILDDFRSLSLAFHGQKQTFRSPLRQDKGHRSAWRAFLSGIQTGVAPIPYAEIHAVSLTAIAAVASIQTDKPIHL